MFKPAPLLIALSIFFTLYWFYNKMATPQHDNKVKVTNLPWQITVKNPETLHVFDLDLGKSTLGDAVKVLKSEYKLAWFENINTDGSTKAISLEAYFLRVSLSGLRAKIVLELDSNNLEIDYLKKHSGKPEILASRSIKYPLDDLALDMSSKTIKSLTYVPQSSVDPQILKNRFGTPEEIIKVGKNVEFGLYPQKGLVIMIDTKGKEAFQYIPTAHFSRLEKSVQKTVKIAQPNQDKQQVK